MARISDIFPALDTDGVAGLFPNPRANVFHLCDGKIAEYPIHVDAAAVVGPNQA